MRNIMKRAHEIARNLEGDYQARMSLALRQAWEEERGLGNEVTELISKFELKLGFRDGKDGIKVMRNATKKDIEKIRELKDVIIAELKKQKAAEKAAAEEREAKINAIEGLKELQKARNAEEDYHHEFNRRMENESLSSFLPARPAVSSKEIAAQYPRAAAYIKAENWKYANNYAKVAAGQKALERIINGENHEQALADMEAEWDAHREENMWN